MNEEYKYGSDNCYCMLTTEWDTKSPVEIWKDIGLGHKEVIALTHDKFYAMMIVDAINEFIYE